MYEKTTLPNGLRILSASLPHTRSVAVGLFVGVGSRYEEAPESGVSHFIEHMLFKGTEKRPTPQEIAIAIEGIGGVFNASTSREITVYWAKVAQHHFPIALDVLVDMFHGSKFEEAEVDKERRVISEEIKWSLDTPDDLVQILVSHLIWPDHPLGQDIAGTLETVGAMTRQRLLGYMGQTYSPHSTVVAAAGNITHPALVEQVAGYLGDWEAAISRDFAPALDSQSEPRLDVHFKETQQAQLAFLLPGLSRSHPDRFSVRVLNAVLGEGMSSRLFLEIRERQGLAYSVHSYMSHMHDTGLLGVSAGVDPEKASSAIQAVQREWGRLRNERVDPEELHKAKEYVKGRLMLQMEDTFATASWTGSQEVLTGEVMTVDEFLEKIDRVAAEDLQRVAQELLLPERVNLALVGPFRADGEFRALLEAPSFV